MGRNSRPPNFELQGRREQTTEFDLQHCRNLRRARINTGMQGPVVHRFVNHQTQFELDALCHRQPIAAVHDQAGDCLVSVILCTGRPNYKTA